MSEEPEEPSGEQALVGRESGSRLVIVGAVGLALLAVVSVALILQRPEGTTAASTTTSPSPVTDGGSVVDDGSGTDPTTSTTASAGTGRIIFDVVQGRTSQVFVIDLASGERDEVASDLSNPSDPTADAAGARVAVVADGPDGAGIYLRRTAGDRFVRQPLPAGSHSPALSPDGTWLAFVSDVEGDDDVYVADLASLSITRLAASSSEEFDPSWDGIGERLVFVRHGSTDDVLVVARPDGTVEAEIRSPGRKRSPSLGPAPVDGRMVASYVGVRGDLYNAETVDLSGTPVRTDATAGVDLALTRTGDRHLVVAVLETGLVVIAPDGTQRTLEATQGAMNPQWLAGGNEPGG